MRSEKRLYGDGERIVCEFDKLKQWISPFAPSNQAGSPIFDGNAASALRVISRIYHLRPRQRNSPYAYFVDLWLQVYEAVEPVIAGSDLSDRPYKVRALDRLLWYLGMGSYDDLQRRASARLKLYDNIIGRGRCTQPIFAKSAVRSCWRYRPRFWISWTFNPELRSAFWWKAGAWWSSHSIGAVTLWMSCSLSATPKLGAQGRIGIGSRANLLVANSSDEARRNLARQSRSRVGARTKRPPTGVDCVAGRLQSDRQSSRGSPHYERRKFRAHRGFRRPTHRSRNPNDRSRSLRSATCPRSGRARRSKTGNHSRANYGRGAGQNLPDI